MRILIDTNILFSALIFPKSKPAKALFEVAKNHDLILCEQNIAEFKAIIARKAPQYLSNAENLLTELQFELIPIVLSSNEDIRDASDQPILNSALEYKVDIIITGDKDFLSLNLANIKCITAAQFLDDYIQCFN